MSLDREKAAAIDILVDNKRRIYARKLELSEMKARITELQDEIGEILAENKQIIGSFDCE